MVFCRTKRGCDKVGTDLVERGFAAGAVHGDLAQGAREQTLRAFRSGKIDVLVATASAAVTSAAGAAVRAAGLAPGLAQVLDLLGLEPGAHPGGAGEGALGADRDVEVGEQVR